MQRIAPSERMKQGLYEELMTQEDPLGEAARRGAQVILQKALEAEVDEYLGRERYERLVGGAIRGYRNGYETKRVQLAEGSVRLEIPQIRDTLEPFESVWLKAIGKRSQGLLELIPAMYVKGMSQRDIESALIEALGVEQTGRQVIGEVCRSLRGDFERWQNRSLEKIPLLYLFLDGLYLRLRPEDKRAIAVLCAYGMLWTGEKVLLHLAIGDKESMACWEAFLEDMKQRGLATPLLTILDGNVGARMAVRRKLPTSLIQRCQAHKMRNIINKLPEVARPTLKKLIYKAFTAAGYKQGLERAKKIIEDYHEAFPAAMKCLEQDMEECLMALKFPLRHRLQIRTTNLLERLFGEGRRRTKVIPRFTSEASGLSLIFAVLVDSSEGWRGVRMTPDIVNRLKQMMDNPDSEWMDPDIEKVAA